ncbi:MAG: Glycerol-3-phosphate acyltransferase [Chloroflexi bacterium]|nr:Glycerol-3-phosphate acyltransferase [Chloroflexota bacterium]
MPNPPEPLILALSALLAYLVGSVPSGAIVARLYRNVDLTRVGSARTGATNTARTLGTGAGVIVLLADFAKGAIVSWGAQQLVGSAAGLSLVGFAAVVGHNRSVFLRGRGGRGVVTGLGCLAVSTPLIFVAACLTGCVVAGSSRFISLGSICGCAACIVGGLIGFATGALPPEFLLLTIVTPSYIIAAHRDNIRRLSAGTERRIGSTSEAQ